MFFKNKYNTIIIGSGISGMTAAIVLAREGEKVLVLEQHTRPGGLMQSYRRGSFLFPTGVHRVGSLGEGEALRHYFTYLDVFHRLTLVPLDPDGFEAFCFPGMTFKVPCGHDAFRLRLHDYFPSEKTAINRFFSDMKKAVSRYNLYNINRVPIDEKLTMNPVSLDTYLDELGCSEKLKGILTGNNPLYGIKPEECPMDTHFLIMDSFLNSSWRIDEYRSPLAGAFVESLQMHGGEIRCGSLVKTILCDDRVARGVVLDTDEQIASDRVIFTGHPNKILDMCPPKAFKPAFKDRLKDSEDTPGAFGVAIKWKGPECPFSTRDVYIYSSWDTTNHYSEQLLPDGKRPGMIFCSALPDNTSGSYSVTALSALNNKDTDYLEKKKHLGNDEYMAAKKLIGNAIFEALKEKWPEMADKMEMADIYTPCTFNRYTLTRGGSAYGIKKAADKFMGSSFHTKTKVKGLFLTGQSILLPGIAGALISSMYTCSVILGRDYLIKKIRQQLQ